MATESHLQAYICSRAADLGMLAFKFESPTMSGVPDLLLITRRGYTFFIEVKHPNKRGRLSPKQKRVIAKMRENNADILIIDCYEDADDQLSARANY